MKEIRLLNTNYNDFDFSVLPQHEVVENGIDDVIIINNYPQRYLYKINQDNQIKDLEYIGFKLVEGDASDGVVVIEKSFDEIHIVKPCETLDSISEKYKIDKKVISEKNKLKGKIFIGQILKL